MDNFLKGCLERMEEFQADILVLFIISWAYATVKMTTSGQICKMSYTAYCNTNCNRDQQYTFCYIVSPLVLNNSLHPNLEFSGTQERSLFENFAWKGENGGNQHFLLFPQCFLLYQRQKSSFEPDLFYCLQNKCFQYGHVQNFVVW